MITTLTEVSEAVQEYGAEIIIGVDEAGRGTWAGPIFAVAVAAPVNWKPGPDVKDSKKLSRKKLMSLYEKYNSKPHEIDFGRSQVPPNGVDRLGIDRAQALAQSEAIRKVFERVKGKALIVVDGISAPSLETIIPMMLLPKADAQVPAVSLASILAKGSQIRVMQEYEEDYPGYGFGKHCGYGTAAHVAALENLGPCNIHRYSYGPVMKLDKRCNGCEVP